MKKDNKKQPATAHKPQFPGWKTCIWPTQPWHSASSLWLFIIHANIHERTFCQKTLCAFWRKPFDRKPRRLTFLSPALSWKRITWHDQIMDICRFCLLTSTALEVHLLLSTSNQNWLYHPVCIYLQLLLSGSNSHKVKLHIPLCLW